MESASVETPNPTIGIRRRVLAVRVVAVVLGLAIALLGVGAAATTLYLGAWSAVGRDSHGPEGGYKFLLTAVVGGTLLLELGVRFATKRVVHRLRSPHRPAELSSGRTPPPGWSPPPGPT